MPERSSVAQVSQIGVETVPGTPVAATRRLGSLIITPSINTEAELNRPEGLKFPTTQTLNREWATADISGQPTYEEVIIPLSGAIDVATVSQVMDGVTPTGAYEWVFTPDSAGADAPKVFTLERGQDGVNVEKFAHLLIAGFGLDLSRSAVSMSGSAFARPAVRGTSLTPALDVPTALTPMTPGSFCVYMATTRAGLESGGSSDPAKRLTRVISFNPAIEDRYTPAWFVNCVEPSFTTWVENADGVGGSINLTAEADTVGMGLLDNIRAGDTLHVRLESKGPVLYNAGTKPNLQALFQWDMALKVENVDGWSDEDGIYAIPWTLRLVHDTTWGKATSVMVRNKVASL